ncbi:PAS domain S-box protein [Pseudohalocynthiibacter aestuariivivens]|nr:PAS domain-containing sensor histidine kinase [Pseudohalocynthiibacter aestuariivivens]QIE45552.1 PAS domain S-box protein [Pseudohalocynthiibacter aestuariivivens]
MVTDTHKQKSADSAIIHAFKHMQVPLMIVEPSGTILHSNRAAGQLFGYSDDNLSKQMIFDVLPVDSVKELNAYIPPGDFDAIIKGIIGRRQDGASVLLAIHLTAWTDENGAIQHALVLRDIAEEMEADRVRKAEMKRADSAIKGARIGVFEFDVKTQSVLVSDLWRELMGLEQTPTKELRMAWMARIHPADLEIAMEPIRRCVDEGHERASSEYRLRSTDGESWRWMRTDLAIAKRDKSGETSCVVGAATDITERKAVESTYHRIAEQFRSSFEAATIGKALVGVDGQFLKVNRSLCELLGYSEDDLCKMDFQSITHPEDLELDLNQFDLLKRGKIPSYKREKRYIRSDGTVLWGLLSVGMITDAEGQPEHFVSQIVDITDQRRLNELKSEFVATVSHELRTPLTSLLGSLTLFSAMEGANLSDGAQRLVSIAEENGKRLSSLINDILDFEKFSARQMSINAAQHEVASLIDDAVLANLPFAEQFGVNFNVTCRERNLAGFFDPKRFQQVLSNFLSNAAKFADEGSTIDILVEAEKHNIRVSVSNQGAGIPESFKDKVFLPFTQAAPVAKRRRGGTGLGLSITKQIVEQMGGDIGFKSNDGEPTTFWFTLPQNMT